jgi:hypothetical protein
MDGKLRGHSASIVPHAERSDPGPTGGDFGDSASTGLRRRISQLLAAKLPIARTIVPSLRSRLPSSPGIERPRSSARRQS